MPLLFEYLNRANANNIKSKAVIGFFYCFSYSFLFPSTETITTLKSINFIIAYNTPFTRQFKEIGSQIFMLSVEMRLRNQPHTVFAL